MIWGFRVSSPKCLHRISPGWSKQLLFASALGAPSGQQSPFVSFWMLSGGAAATEGAAASRGSQSQREFRRLLICCGVQHISDLV